MKSVVVLLVLVGLIVGTSLADEAPKAKSPQNEGEPTKKNEEPKAASTQTVIAEGVGTTADEALKDAFRSAVRQVVGALVDAETLVKNDEVISDKVLTFSNGFVKKYDELSKKEDKGLVRIKIKAEVERKAVVEKLKAANVKVKEVDGKGLFAEAVTDLEREKDAAALLKKALEGFPLNCMTATVVGDPKVIEKNGDKATVSITVQVEPNLEAYKAFVKKIQPVLEKMADKDNQGEFSVFAKKQQKEQEGFTVDLQIRDEADRHLRFNPHRLWMRKAFEYKGNVGHRVVGDKIVVALCTEMSKAADRLEYKFFMLDKATQDTLGEIFGVRCQCKLSFVDNADEFLIGDRFDTPFGKFSESAFTASLVAAHSASADRYSEFHEHWKEQKTTVFYISPTFMLVGEAFGNGVQYAPQLRIERNLALTLDELKKVQKAKVELQAK